MSVAISLKISGHALDTHKCPNSDLSLFFLTLAGEVYKKKAEENILTINILILPLQVIRLGFEPRTHSLEGCCSIQLSYPTILLNCDAKVGDIFYYSKCFENFFQRKIDFLFSLHKNLPSTPYISKYCKYNPNCVFFAQNKKKRLQTEFPYCNLSVFSSAKPKNGSECFKKL